MKPNEHIEPEVPIPDEIQADTGYDKQEPPAGLIAGLSFATFVALIVVILGVRAYFDYSKQQYEEQQSQAIAEDLRNLRNNEDTVLGSYKVLDKANGVVQIPVNRAMELVASEAAAGKLTYAQKTYPVKSATAGAPEANGKPAPAAAVPAKVPDGSASTPPAAK